MANLLRQAAIRRLPSLHHEHPTYRWWVLATVLITTFMAVLEATVVNTALPSMQNAFGTSLDIIQWVLTAFTLVSAVVLPLSGWLADKVGYKRTFILSLILFTVGSGLCSLAWNESVLIFFRIVQAIGAGMIQPVGMAMVTREFPPNQRGMAMGFYGIAAAASISVGPSLGGFLTDTFGWASVFLINVPFGALGIIASYLIQKEYKNPNVGKFDTWGFTAVAIFLVSLLLALGDGNAGWNTGGWTSPFIITCFGISFVAFVIFLYIELTIDKPIVDLRLLLERNFGLSNLLLFVIGFVLMGSTFLFPVYLQGNLGYTALQSGLMFLPLGIVQAAISPVTGILADKTSPKIPSILGVLVLMVSFYMNTFLSANPPYWLLMVPIILRGVGFGLLFIALQSVSVNSLPRDKIAQGSGLIALTRQIGASFGVAVFGAILNYRGSFHNAVAGEAMDSTSEMFRSTVTGLKYALMSDGGQTASTAGTMAQQIIIKNAASDVFIQSVNDSFWIVTITILLSLVPILLIKMERKPKEVTVHIGE